MAKDIVKVGNSVEAGNGATVSWWAKLATPLRKRVVRVGLLGAVALGAAGLLVPREMTQAAIGAVVSPLTVLDGRGPGGRIGALTTTKPPKAFLARLPAGASAGTRERAPASGTAPGAPSAYLAQVPGYGSAGPGPVPPIGSPAQGDSLVSEVMDPGPVPSALVPPQASTDPNATGTDPSNPLPNDPGVPNPPPSSPGGAVPEASAWIMMILGLFGTGAALRRSRSRPQRELSYA